jgi:hypothetical protein
MLKYSHPILAWLIHYWPASLFLPSILLLIAVLVVVTHKWDQQGGAVPRRFRDGQPGEQRRS